MKFLENGSRPQPPTSLYHVQFLRYYAFLFFLYYTYQSIDGLYISSYFTHVPCPPLSVLRLSLLDVLHSSIQGFTSHFLILYSCTMFFFSSHITRILLLIDLKFTYALLCLFYPFYIIHLHVLLSFTFSYILLYSCTIPFFSLNIVLIHLLITLHLLVLYA